jgi:hypothetical protein
LHIRSAFDAKCRQATGIANSFFRETSLAPVRKGGDGVVSQRKLSYHRRRKQKDPNE